MIEVQLRNPQGELYVPRPTQAKFHACSAAARALLGGMGSGKSIAGLAEGLIQSLEVESGKGGKGLIARFRWEELVSATWPMFLGIIPYEIKYLCRLRERPYPQAIFPNGFEVRGMNFNDPDKLGSEEYSWIDLDECGEPGLGEEHLLWMLGRIRNKVGRRQMWLMGHPAGRNYVWKYFFAHEEDRTHQRYPDFEGFRNTTEENTSLDPEYIARMRRTYPEEWISRYLDGDFGVAEGMILDSFDPDIHLVQPFMIPGAWPRYRGIDHGLTHPTTCLWVASDFEGSHVVYREHAKRNITPAENVAIILAQSKGEEELVEWTVIDPATRQKQTAGGVIQAIIDQYREAGLYCREGNNEIPPSITLLKHLLRPDPERLFPKWHHYAGTPGSPRLFLTTDCPRLKWEIEQWRWMDIKPGQIDRQKVLAKDDDEIAALRYILMERPREAVVVPKPGREQVILEIIRELAEERRGGDEELIGQERI